MSFSISELWGRDVGFSGYKMNPFPLQRIGRCSGYLLTLKLPTVPAKRQKGADQLPVLFYCLPT